MSANSFNPAVASASEIGKEVTKAAGSIKNASNAIFQIVVMACRRYHNTVKTEALAADSGGCDVMTNILNALATLPRYQAKAADIFHRVANIKIIEQNGKKKVSNVLSLSEMPAEEKVKAQSFIDEIESAATAGATLINYDKTTSEPKEIIYRKIENLDKARLYRVKGSRDLLANLLLSFDDLSIEAAKAQLIEAINSLQDSEIEAEKAAIMKKIEDKNKKKAPKQEPEDKAAA
ncbi:hypothetical protein VAA96_004546 [Salmonella enterica]|nr:hypothetical protein [Salmonella enterica]